MIESLHFLRPLWLVVIPAMGVLWWLVRRREAGRADVGSLIAPHLRDALTINHDARRGIRAVDAVALTVIIVTAAAAGPTWSRQKSPWFAESAPLVIAVEVTDSMRSNDLLPTRLDRARFKVLDLVAERTGSRTALIAYAGSAHVVMPPSTDIEVLKPFLESLDPSIMPESGANAAAVLPLARTLLGENSAPGTLLFVNDGFDPADIGALAAFAGESGSPAMAALVVGTDAGGVALLPDGSPVLAPGGARVDTTIDGAILRRAATEAGVSVVRSSTGDRDIRQLLRAVASNLRQADDPDARWQDQAWWLLWPAALLTAAWFRRGWTMQW
jgi:Ca-activated chloride channel family protein